MTGWAGDYATLAEMHAHLRIPDADTADDTEIGVAITSASRAIDHDTRRQFGLTGSAVARVYTYVGESIEGRLSLAIDDVQTTTGLAVALDLNYDGTFETSLTNGTDYDLWPWNAAADGKPWTHVVLRPTTSAWFPFFARGVQVTANYGWSAVPSVVKTATRIQAARFFTRRDSTYGIAGSPQVGSELRLLDRLDPDVSLSLASVRRARMGTR